MLIQSLFELVGFTCLSANLAFITLLVAAFARRWADGMAGAAADVADSLD